MGLGGSRRDTVRLSLGNYYLETKADESGKWKILLPPTSAGGPYTMYIEAENSLKVEDVLFGEVWLCGGQSNMQYTLDMLGYQEADSARAHNAMLRMINVAVDLDYLPKEDIKGGFWQPASPESIGSFSAVAYFYTSVSAGAPGGAGRADQQQPGRHHHRNLDECWSPERFSSIQPDCGKDQFAE
ncbi:MAG: hypothetical protein H6558_02950 [Lewinellaceae bacterium]|nr:hypothetical protein [Lewinellaceae bacterium]